MERNIKLSDLLLKEMEKKAGWRERYVINKYRNDDCIIKFRDNGSCVQFKYSPKEEYQDANGATFSLIKRRWVN